MLLWQSVIALFAAAGGVHDPGSSSVGPAFARRSMHASISRGIFRLSGNAERREVPNVQFDLGATTTAVCSTFICLSNALPALAGQTHFNPDGCPFLIFVRQKN
jgi:hypothetical protein